MKRIIIYALFLTWCITSVHAQSAEIGFNLGGMSYQGELNPSATKWWKLNTIHPSVGLMYRYNLNDFLAFRMNLAQGTISGNDALADTEKRRARNLHFKSNIQDLSAMMEVNFLRFNPSEGQDFAIYAVAGLGVFHFNPKALYEGDWVALQPLGTEGQFLNGEDNSYSLWNISLPAGIGVKYALNERWTVGAEMLYRLTFTDYLDDVSTVYPNQGVLLEEMGIIAASLSDRKGELPNNDPNPSDGRVRGNVDNKDAFFSGGLTLTYRLITSNAKRQKMRQLRNHCPKF